MLEENNGGRIYPTARGDGSSDPTHNMVGTWIWHGWEIFSPDPSDKFGMVPDRWINEA